MKNKGTIKNIVIGLFLAIAGLVVYAVVVGSPDGSTGGSATFTSLLESNSFGQVQETDVQLANAEILRVLGSIQDIQLEDDIFTNPVFDALRDSQFTIPRPTQIGRPNPFRPIGLDSISTLVSIPNITTVPSENTVSDTNSDFFSDSSLGNLDQEGLN